MKKVKPLNGKMQNSSEIVGSNDDLLTEILLLVPIKPLMCFKSVSKHWLSLITNHSFCVRRNPTPNPPTGLFLSTKDQNQYHYEYIPLYPNQNPNPPPFNLHFATDPLKTEIIHSCYGLLLLLCCTSSSECSIYVYNPTTNSSTALPDIPPHLCSATLVFDPVKSPHYKVVLLPDLHSTRKEVRVCEIKVYSSQTRRWSHCDVLKYANVNGHGVYWNGSVHWLNSRPQDNSIRFHVDTLVVGEMPTPPSVRSDYYFGESCGHMHFVDYDLPSFSIYEMKMDYSEWFVKYRLDFTCIAAAFPEVVVVISVNTVRYTCRVLSVIRGEGEEASLVMRIPGKAVKFSLVDGTSEKLRDFAHDKLRRVLCIIVHVIDNGDVKFVETYKFEGMSGIDYIQSLCSC